VSPSDARTQRGFIALSDATYHIGAVAKSCNTCRCFAWVYEWNLTCIYIYIYIYIYICIYIKHLQRIWRTHIQKAQAQCGMLLPAIFGVDHAIVSRLHATSRCACVGAVMHASQNKSKRWMYQCWTRRHIDRVQEDNLCEVVLFLLEMVHLFLFNWKTCLSPPAFEHWCRHGLGPARHTPDRMGLLHPTWVKLDPCVATCRWLDQRHEGSGVYHSPELQPYS
jgi:hypothetical protein